jgi:plastocyanin
MQKFESMSKETSLARLPAFDPHVKLRSPASNCRTCKLGRCLALMPLGLAIALWLAPSLWAATFTVQMTGFTFSPNTLSIGQGDTVIWTNLGPFGHTSTSGNAPNHSGLWDSGTLGGSQTFAATFNNFAPRTYPYFCSFHYLSGMTGSLTITNGTSPPPLLSSPSWRNGQFQFTLDGTRGQSYVIEMSPDLGSWGPVSTNLATSTQLTVVEPGASNSVGFYRARLGP